MSQLAHVTTPTWAWTSLLLPPWSKQFKCKDVSQAKPQFQNKRMEKKNRKIKQPWQSRGKLQLPCLGLFGFVPFCLAFVDSFLISVMFFSLFWKGQLASCFVTLAKC